MVTVLTFHAVVAGIAAAVALGAMAVLGTMLYVRRRGKPGARDAVFGEDSGVELHRSASEVPLNARYCVATCW